MILYNLPEQYRSIFNLIETDEETGEILNPEILPVVDAVHEDAIEALESAALYVRELEAEKAALAEEEKRLAARKKSLARRIDRFKGYLLNGVQTVGRVKTPLVTVSERHSQRVVVDDVSLLPPEMLRVTTAPDAAAIKAAMKAGEAVNGARLEFNTTVQIR